MVTKSKKHYNPIFVVAAIGIVIIALIALYFFNSTPSNENLPINSNPQITNSNTQIVNSSINTTPSSNQLAPNTEAITISGFAFSPREIKIKVGTTLVWTNTDSAIHTVTSDSTAELESPGLAKGQTYSHTFTKPGLIKYHCNYHPSMRGTITIKE